MNTNSPLHRCFIAFVLPQAIRKYCSHVQAELGRRHVRGKFVDPGHCHLTIHFLGDIPLEELFRIHDATLPLASQLREVVFTPVALGSFGRPPRVLFLELADEGGHGKALVTEFRSLAGLSDEKGKEWIAHATLARFRSSGEAKSWDGATELPDPPASFRPAGIGFFTSVLSDKGPQHTCERLLAQP